MKSKIKQCPDGGYGWVIVIASATIFGLAISVVRCTGVIYANLVETSNFTRTQLASVMTIPAFLNFALTIFPIKLATMYSFKLTLFIGIFTFSGGIFLSSFAVDNLVNLIFSFVIIGVGVSFSTTPCTILAGLYFNKKRPIAVALLLSIGGIPGLVLPIILQWFINEYHLQNSLILWSGISLHGCIAAMLIRQPTWTFKTTRKKSQVDETQEQQTFLQCSENEENKSKINHFYISLKLIFKELIRDFRHFRNCIFILMLGNRISFFFQLICFGLIIPRFAKEQIEGITTIQAAFLLSVASLADLIAKLLGGFINNFFSNRTIVYLVNLTCLGVVIILFQFTHTYPSIMALCVILGLFGGYCHVTYMIVMFDIFGPSDTPGAVALHYEIKGFFLLASGPLMGWIRELTGSYKHCFTVLAGLTLLSVVVWLFNGKCKTTKVKEEI